MNPLFSFHIIHVLLLPPSTAYKTRDCIPQLVTDYLQNKINTDPLITHQLPFEKINDAFKLLQNESW